MGRGQGASSRHHTQRPFGLDAVDVADLSAFEYSEVDRLAELGGQLLHHRPRLLAHVERSDDGKSDLDEGGTCDVCPSDRFLLHETVVGKHGE